MRMMYKGDDKMAMMSDDGKIMYTIPYHTDGIGKPCKSLDEWSLSINTKNLQIVQQDVGLTIDISDDVLSQVSSIEINGFKFIKEK